MLEIFRKILDRATLKQEIKYLRKENEELKEKEKPYIDKITKLKSELRTTRIQYTKLKKKVGIDE